MIGDAVIGGTTTDRSFRLSADDLTCLLPASDFAQLPDVLALRPTVDTIGRLRDLRSTTARARREQGLTGADDRPTEDVSTLLAALTRPHGRLEVRAVDHGAQPSVSLRACLCVDAAGLAVWAHASGGVLSLSRVDGDTTAHVTRALGHGEPATSESVVRRTDEFVVRGDDVITPCRRHLELVGTLHRHGVTTRPVDPIALYDTKTGRILARTTAAVDGTRWTTLSPATDRRVRSAVSALLDPLSGGHRAHSPLLTHHLVG